MFWKSGSEIPPRNQSSDNAGGIEHDATFNYPSVEGKLHKKTADADEAEKNSFHCNECDFKTNLNHFLIIHKSTDHKKDNIVL